MANCLLTPNPEWVFVQSALSDPPLTEDKECYAKWLQKCERLKALYFKHDGDCSAALKEYKEGK
jgi:hypothetical protein